MFMGNIVYYSLAQCVVVFDERNVGEMQAVRSSILTFSAVETSDASVRLSKQ